MYTSGHDVGLAAFGGGRWLLLGDRPCALLAHWGARLIDLSRQRRILLITVVGTAVDGFAD